MRYMVQNKTYDFLVKFYPCDLSAVPHIHSHFEMIYLASGKAEAVLDGKKYTFRAGDLFMAGANQTHFYENVDGPVSFYLILFSDAMDPDIKKILRGRIPQEPVLRAQRLPADIRQQLDAVAGARSTEGAHGHLEAKGRFLTLMGQVLGSYTYQQAQTDHDSIKRVLAYCLEHYTQPITLDSTSQQLYMSKYHISHIFSRHMGRSFTAFLTDLRLEHACELLGEQGNITQVAFASGFSSVRTFNRAFLKSKGISPREYIARKNAASK